MRRLIVATALVAAVGCSGSGSSSSASSTSTSTSTSSTTTSSGSTGSSASGSSSGSTGSSGSSAGSTTTGSGSSSGSSGSSGSTGSGTLQQFCGNASPLICQFLEACGAIDPGVDCASFQAGCETLQPGQGFDANQGAACLSALQAALASQSCDLSTAQNVCDTVFVPAVPEGGDCGDDSNCIQRPDGGLVACDQSAGCPGTCTAGGLLNQPCIASLCQQGFCDPELQLDDGGFQETCVAYAEAGEPCEQANDIQCDTGLSCVLGDSGALTCRPLGTDGESCTINGDCVATDYCNFAGNNAVGTCTVGAQLGQSCQSTPQDTCVSPNFCAQGSCISPFPSIGQTCAPGAADCVEGACSVPSGQSLGTCVIAPVVGEACVDGDCAVGFCDAGTCVPEAVAGQPCANEGDCREGDFCNDGGCQLSADLGQPCVFGAFNACLNGYCSADAGTCQPTLAGGAVCDPNQGECSGQTSTCSEGSDGGEQCVDPACFVPDDGGSPRCAIATLCRGS